MLVPIASHRKYPYNHSLHTAKKFENLSSGRLEDIRTSVLFAQIKYSFMNLKRTKNDPRVQIRGVIRVMEGCTVSTKNEEKWQKHMKSPAVAISSILKQF